MANGRDNAACFFNFEWLTIWTPSVEFRPLPTTCAKESGESTGGVSSHGVVRVVSSKRTTCPLRIYLMTARTTAAKQAPKPPPASSSGRSASLTARTAAPRHATLRPLPVYLAGAKVCRLERRTLKEKLSGSAEIRGSPGFGKKCPRKVLHLRTSLVGFWVVALSKHQERFLMISKVMQKFCAIAAPGPVCLWPGVSLARCVSGPVCLWPGVSLGSSKSA